MPNLATMAMMRGYNYVPDPSVKFMVGVSTTNSRGQTTAQSMATTESFCGHQSIHRDYANASYTNFMVSQRAIDVDTTNSVSLRTTHVSWNPSSLALQNENPSDSSTQFSGFNPTQLQLYLQNGSGDLTSYGTETQANIQWLLSIPLYHKVILNPWHEADNYQDSNDYGSNYGQFRNAFRVLADIIHTFNNQNWQVCLLLTAYAWKGNSGTSNQPSNFYPCWNGLPATGTQYVDVMGVDVYNEGSVNGTNWDSPAASMGIPMTESEQSIYQGRYGGTNGYRTTDASGLTWTNGFLGWCERIGIKKWIVGELGTQRNINSVNGSWTSAINASSTKSDWIREFGRFAAAYNSNTFHNAKCIGLEYFMSAGRTYTGSNYLSSIIHDGTTGALINGIVASVASYASLPSGLTNANAGQQYLTTDTKHVWNWNGSAYVDTGASISESWQLWWNADGSGWDGTNSAYYGWADVTKSYGLATG